MSLKEKIAVQRRLLQQKIQAQLEKIKKLSRREPENPERGQLVGAKRKVIANDDQKLAGTGIEYGEPVKRPKVGANGVLDLDASAQSSAEQQYEEPRYANPFGKAYIQLPRVHKEPHASSSPK